MGASIPRAIVQEIEAHTGSTVGDFSFASGGCINNGGRIVTADDAFFVKWNDRMLFPAMFEAEAKGLSLLRRSTPLFAPEVVLSGQTESYQFLLMEHIDEGNRAPGYWEALGAGLAALHRTRSKEFGLDHDNYIGSLPQYNKPSGSWPDFFVEQRLRVQLRRAFDKGAFDKSLSRQFEELFRKIPALLPIEPPSLLHGDLWSGNIMTSSQGMPCIIDPAVYYGHREVDLAMTQLFGGFDNSFLDSYREAYPLSPGYEERLILYNLYPLLVHVNLFGGGYAAQVMHALKRFL